MIVAPPRFEGYITITGTNDRIDWDEDVGGGGVAVHAFLAVGDYWPVDFFTHLGVRMTAASPGGVTYSGPTSLDFGAAGGKGTITAAGGGVVGWRPKITAAEARKCLTGGDVAVGSVGASHAGWYVDAAYPAYALAHTADIAIAHSWYPSLPPETLVPREDAVVSEIVSLGGKSRLIDWSGRVQVGSTSYLRQLSLSWSWLTDADLTMYRDSFWNAYARGGRTIRYFPDRTLTTYTEEMLAGDSVREFAPSRMSGYPYWRWGISLRKVKP